VHAHAGVACTDRGAAVLAAVLAAVPDGRKGSALIQRDVLVQLEVLLAAWNAATGLREAAAAGNAVTLPQLQLEESQAAAAFKAARDEVLRAQGDVNRRAGEIA
jgi:hypothetical protein